MVELLENHHTRKDVGQVTLGPSTFPGYQRVGGPVRSRIGFPTLYLGARAALAGLGIDGIGCLLSALAAAGGQRPPG